MHGGVPISDRFRILHRPRSARHRFDLRDSGVCHWGNFGSDWHLHARTGTTTIISKWKGQDEIGLGTVLGSNVFNGLFIIGLAATIAPIQVMFAQVGWALAVGLIATTLTLPMRNGLIPRARGFYLLALYLIFVVVALQR
jgi:hypothetical protein